MISIIDSGKLVNTEVSPMVPRSCEMVGLSTDTKPTGVSVGNGWSFIEMDTGKVFFYDAESEEWLEFAGSGGGGGQGGSNVLVVHVDWGTELLDKTWQEISDADVAVVVDASGENTKLVNLIEEIGSNNGTYGVAYFSPVGDGTVVRTDFTTNSASGYPAFTTI